MLDLPVTELNVPDIEKGVINIWGRVRDHRGNCVEGALVVLLVSSKGEDLCLGRTYSCRQGLYCFSISNPENNLLARNLRTVACAGTPAVDREDQGLIYSRFFRPTGGKTATIECQVINYQYLKIIVSNGKGPLIVETLPETVKVSFSQDHIAAVCVYGIRGRGYISGDSGEGEALFNLTVCVLGEGPWQQEMVKIKIMSADKRKKTPVFDSGPFVANLQY